MNPEEKDEVVQLHLDDIIPNRFQPREVFDEKALKELAISIKEHGVIQPIIVRSVNGKYEIIAGERRYKASALAGLTKIPAIIRELDDKETSKVALLENLQRKNLNPIEEARTYQKILELDQMTQEDLAKTMGKSQSSIANKIRLLSLPEEIQSALLKEEISERHARSLLNVPTAEEQKEFLKRIIDTKMSVRALEDEIKEKYQPATPMEEVATPMASIPEMNISVPGNPTIPEIVPSTNAFMNTEPLAPTAALPADASNYGKVTIAPPQEEQEPSNTNKFINYGEIQKEEDMENDQAALTALNTAPVDINVDMNSVRETTVDLPTPKKGTADLDNLLNLGNPNSATPPTQFVTPAEKIVKTSVTETPDMEEDTNTDYFQISDLSDVNSLPSSMMGNMNMNTNVFMTPPEDTNRNYTIEEAENKIKDLVKELTNHGIKITSNEMNFDKSYQVIIKIDKE